MIWTPAQLQAWPWLVLVDERVRERFESRIELRDMGHAAGLCEIWTGGTSSGGGPGRLTYGTFWVGERVTVRAHIFSSLVRGRGHLPGQHVDHLCQSTLCQHHLEGVPPDENLRRRWERRPAPRRAAGR